MGERRTGVLRRLASSVLLIVPVAALPVLYLSPYFGRRFSVAVGGDYPQYLLRARIAASGGLAALAEAFPPPFHANPDRPGFPALANLLDSVVGIAPERIGFVLPAIAAVAIGLAAGAVAVGAMREPSWSLPVYALLVGGSVAVVLTARGHLDNLLVDAVLMAAAGAVLSVAAGGRGAVALVVLLVSAATIHRLFALLFVGIAAAFAVMLIPESLRIRSAGLSWLRTPSGRVGTALAASVGIGAGTALLAPGSAPAPEISTSRLRLLFDLRVPTFRFGVQVPVAAAGAVGLAVADHAGALPGRDVAERVTGRRRALLLWVAWLGIAAAAIVALLAGLGIAAHRFLNFALPLPILVAAAAVATARVRVWLAAVLIPVLLGAGFWAAWTVIREESPILGDNALGQTEVAAAYIESVAPRDVVVLVDQPLDTRGSTNPSSAYRFTRAAVSEEVGDHVLFYLGDLSNLMSGEPTIRPGQPLFNETSTVAARAAARAVRRGAAVVTMRSFNRSFDRIAEGRQDRRIGRGVLAIRGPVVPVTTGAPGEPPRPTELLLQSLAAVVLLMLVGSGWSAALGSTGWLVAAGNAAAFGIGMLCLVGTITGRLGAALSGAGGAIVVVVTAAVGWAVFGAARIRTAAPGARQPTA